MITYLKGDLLNSPAQVLVNTVNTVGVMGKGIALEFKKKYPDVFKIYQKACEEKRLDIGKLLLWRSKTKSILMFPTKKHWRNPSKLEYIEAGLVQFAKSWDAMHIDSVAFPKLGCGNGGLKWEDVKPLMEKHLKPLPIKVYVYVDKYTESTPEHLVQNEMESWLMSQPGNIGFNFLVESMRKQLSTPKSFIISNNETYTAVFENDELVMKNGDMYTINSEDLCNFWSHIRLSGVLEGQKLPEQFLPYGEILLELFHHMKYLEPVILVEFMDHSVKEMRGYQYVKPKSEEFGL